MSAILSTHNTALWCAWQQFVSVIPQGTNLHSHQGNVSELVIVLIILLLVATGVALLSRQFRIPYVTGLVLAGLAITELLPRRIGLDPSLILNLFLPILLFEAAINTDISRLRSTIKPITVLAGPGLVISSGITAVLLKFGLGLAWIPALLAGVILAVTDTVSVIAVFQEVPVPSRLSTIVEWYSFAVARGTSHEFALASATVTNCSFFSLRAADRGITSSTDGSQGGSR